MTLRPYALAALASLASLAWTGLSQAAPPASKALAPCVGITDGAERLACYDKLAGRAVAPPPPASAEPVAPAAASAPATVAETPAPAEAPAPAPASVPLAVSQPRPAAAAAPPPSTFGLYAAEHPKPPPVRPQLDGRVAGFGQSRDGRATVRLESGAVWELLDDADPLLAVGDGITIRRAALGSYLMSTPTKRIHRVRRLH